jgi:acyl carrier protein
MNNEIFMDAIADALGVERADLTDDTALNEANCDSFGHMAAISAIDEKFGVTVPAKDLTSVHTVGELRHLVERSIAQGSVT